MKKAETILKKTVLFTDVLRAVFLFAVLYFLMVVETTWANWFSFFGAIPDVVLVFVICFSLHQGGLYAVFLSVISGLMLDLLCGKVLPKDMVLYLYISCGCVWISNRVFLKGFKMSAVAVFLFSLLYRLTEAGFSFFIEDTFCFSASFLFLKAVANTLCAFLINPLARLFVKERGRGFEAEL